MQQRERTYYGDTSTVLYAGDGSSYVPSITPEYAASFESPVAYPYIDSNAILDSHISNAFWKNTTGSWTTFSGNSGKALAIETASADSTLLTFYYDIETGYKMSLQSFSFYQRSSSTGYAQWSLLVNDTQVGQGSIFVDAVNQTNPVQWTGDQALTTAMNNLSGTVRIDIVLKGGTHGSQGTFRMDNFTLNGYTVPTSYSNPAPNLYIHKAGYRYGFNGKENDNEVKGEGNQQDYGMRIYDPRIGRFLSVDPLTEKYAELTPFQFSSNRPIDGIDLDGEEFKSYSHRFVVEFASGEPKITYLRTETKELTNPGWLSRLLFDSKTPTHDVHIYVAVNSKDEVMGVGSGFLPAMYDSYAQLKATTERTAKYFNGNKEVVQEENLKQAGYLVASLVLAKGVTVFGTSFSTNSSTVPEQTTNKQTTAANSGNTNASTSNTTQQTSGSNAQGTSTSPTSKFLGGAKGDLYSKRNILEANHLPTMKSIDLAGFKISYDKGSAFQMLYEEHRVFISTGSSKAAVAFRTQEASLLQQGKFMEAFELNVERVQAAYGTKYNSAIDEARAYYQKSIVPQMQQQLKQKTTTTTTTTQ